MSSPISIELQGQGHRINLSGYQASMLQRKSGQQTRQESKHNGYGVSLIRDGHPQI